MKTRKIAWMLAIVFACMAYLVYHQYSSIRLLNQEPGFYKTDQDFVNNAIKLWSAEVKEEENVAMQNRYAVAVHFPDEVCVELRLRLGSLGGNPVYCFDRKSKAVTRKFDQVE
ncbi:MAG: hypothetical protein V4610_06290 [Pseudomonadota bacterium]|jgi:hypothetical protein